jgi:hypothetical protein
MKKGNGGRLEACAASRGEGQLARKRRAHPRNDDSRDALFGEATYI